VTGKITWRNNMDGYANKVLFVITAEQDYEYLVEYKEWAHSLREALQKLNLDLRQVRDVEVR
jgi:peptidase E